MRATKKRANIIYQVLLKHFGVDEFLLEWSHFKQKMLIYVSKNHCVRSLESEHMELEFKWATKHLVTRCSSRITGLHPKITSIDSFLKYLQIVSPDFRCGNKSLIDIKHELVKQLLKTLREHFYIIVRRPSIAPTSEYEYTIDKIWNFEELFIQEELNAKYN